MSDAPSGTSFLTSLLGRKAQILSGPQARSGAGEIVVPVAREAPAKP